MKWKLTCASLCSLGESLEKSQEGFLEGISSSTAITKTQIVKKGSKLSLLYTNVSIYIQM